MKKLEVNFVKFIQSKLYDSKYNFIDDLAKFISGRKYRLVYLILYLFFSMFYFDYLKLSTILKIYLYGYLSRELNIYIKLLFKRKRPFVDHEDIKTSDKTKIKKSDTYSLPSNSIQTSIIFYHTLLKSISFDIYSIIIILSVFVLIISLSKINKGLHYPSDIIVSIVLVYFLIQLEILVTYLI